MVYLFFIDEQGKKFYKNLKFDLGYAAWSYSKKKGGSNSQLNKKEGFRQKF